MAVILIGSSLFFLLLVVPTDWSPMSLVRALLAWAFPFGLLLGVGVLWLYGLKAGRDAIWEFDETGASLWVPMLGRSRVEWSSVESVDAYVGYWQLDWPANMLGLVSPALTLAPTGAGRQPWVYRVSTRWVRKDALAVLAQQIALHVPEARTTARFSAWFKAVTHPVNPGFEDGHVDPQSDPLLQSRVQQDHEVTEADRNVDSLQWWLFMLTITILCWPLGGYLILRSSVPTQDQKGIVVAVLAAFGVALAALIVAMSLAPSALVGLVN